MHAVRLAVDIHGGDHGPALFIKGIVDIADRYRNPLCIHLCGNHDTIVSAFAMHNVPLKRGNVECVVEHCSQSISNRDVPSRAWKIKTQSSIVRCIALQKEGVVDASLSAGDTRFLMAASVFILGRSQGVTRPALAAILPAATHKSVLVLDVGANLSCRAEHLAAFGRMGYAYAQTFFGIENPSVALLSIGTEPSKATHACKGYAGFIEGGGVLAGSADVVVCDGFSGNVLLKACESFYSLALSIVSENPAMTNFMKKKIAILNPENYGAVPLLGIKGAVYKAHGSSSATVIGNALMTTIRAAERNILCAGHHESITPERNAAVV
jgi:glycerol-3-phosphate acyltransferase PlsX